MPFHIIGSKTLSLWHFYCLQSKSISEIAPEILPVVSLPPGHILGKVFFFDFLCLLFLLVFLNHQTSRDTTQEPVL